MAAGQNFADAATAACVWSTLLNNKPLLPFQETLSHHPPPWPSSASASTSEGPTRTSYPHHATLTDSVSISDAVLLNVSDRQVLASAKHPTTPDVTQGIQSAIQTVLNHVPHATDIQAISIGTTVCYPVASSYATQFPPALCERTCREKSRPTRSGGCHPSLRSIYPWHSPVRWFPARPEK